MSGSKVARYVAAFLCCLLLAAGFALSPDTAPGTTAPAPEETEALVEAIKAASESDSDEDGLLNEDDEDDDGDLVEDAEDPAPYDPYDPKPWMGEDFRAPEGSAEREALWEPEVGAWTTPGGGECKEFESGAKICDHPDGSTLVWIVEDWTAWMQDSGGGKEQIIRPADRPPNPPSGGGSGGGGGDNYEADPMDREESSLIANHAINNSGHHVPGIEPWDDVGKLDDYVYNAVNGVEFGREFGQVPSGLEGPYYPETGNKKAYWDDNRKVIMVRNPNDTSGGTVFKPDNEREYLDDNFQYSTPPSSR